MKDLVIGRHHEMEILDKLLQSKKPELLALYGRRRIGKTYLIKTFYSEDLVFSCSGQHLGKTKEQLGNFMEQLKRYFPDSERKVVTTWQEAFTRLRESLEQVKGSSKKVIFFDELPWLDNHKSGFLSSFSYFWNSYASDRNDLLVVICGSAASWIIDKIINSRGGMHNRVTQHIRLLPFTLLETELYLQHRKIIVDRYSLMQLYMVMGGVPAYLDSVQRGKSIMQNIETICFSKDGMLNNEFDNLYPSLFNNPEKHIQIITTLARKNSGLTRSDISESGKILTGGGLSVALQELRESGFIAEVPATGKKIKDSIFRLIDEFSLFYFKFMQQPKGSWSSRYRSPAYTSWCGYAFENICFKHILQIKKALQIAGIHSEAFSWFKAGRKTSPGAQIDLLIDRDDRFVNICEMKFSDKLFTITKKYAADLQNKITVFRSDSEGRKNLLLTFITTYGIEQNDYKEQLVDNEITMDQLFS